MSNCRSLIGKPAPPFKLKNYDGQDYEVSPGKANLPLVIFFYRESVYEMRNTESCKCPFFIDIDSYGCTQQACQIRDAMLKKVAFSPDKVQIIGISPDPVEKQKSFVEKEKLTYPVLSDVPKEIFELYGIGKGLWGLTRVGRVTFMINRQGIVRYVFESTMNYSGHVKVVERWLARVRSGEL